MKLACIVIGCLPMFGQTSRMSSVTKARGENVTLDVVAESQPDRAPVGLKWEVVFPAQMMEMEGDGPEIGSAAKDSGKSVQCIARTPYRLVCSLSGGQKPIANGPMAIFHFRVRSAAPPGTASLRIEKTECTAADSRKFTLNDTEATVIIK